MRNLTPVMLLALLGGCMAPRIDAGRYAVDYNRAVEIEANETVLLNVIRSKYRTATHYTSTTGITAKLRAQQSADVSIGYDEGAFSQSLGPDGKVLGASRGDNILSGSAGYSLTYAQEPTFSIAVHNTPDFARGTLSAISRDNFYRLVGEGYRTSMMVELLIESMTISDRRTGASLRLVNPAGRRGERCDAGLFRGVRDALRIYPKVNTGKAPVVASFEPTLDNLVKAEPLLAKGFTFGARKAGSKTIDLHGKAPDAQLTADSNLGEIPTLVKDFEDCMAAAEPKSPVAQSAIKALTAAPADLAGEGSLQISFNLRSVDGVVYAMGEYLRQMHDCGANAAWKQGYSASGRTSDSCVPTTIRSSDGSRDELFVVVEQDAKAKANTALAHTTYMGRRWVVPEWNTGSEHRTMQVINVIQKLLNLNKSADEIRTPTFILD
ncbi:MAG: hypothetical protein R3D89_11515 [Sphingomonadaceae bacterium]